MPFWDYFHKHLKQLFLISRPISVNRQWRPKNFEENMTQTISSLTKYPKLNCSFFWNSHTWLNFRPNWGLATWTHRMMLDYSILIVLHAKSKKSSKTKSYCCWRRLRFNTPSSPIFPPLVSWERQRTSSHPSQWPSLFPFQVEWCFGGGGRNVTLGSLPMKFTSKMIEEWGA